MSYKKGMSYSSLSRALKKAVSTGRRQATARAKKVPIWMWVAGALVAIMVFMPSLWQSLASKLKSISDPKIDKMNG